MTQMQGIVSILRSDNPEKPTKAASLRRTLSADMSSKRWLADNGLPAMKKIASFEQIAVDSSNSSSESDEEECDQVIGKQSDEIPTRMDIWTAIMSQKKQDDSVLLPPPYVHPLVKKSASSLSEKSLKVCTESLGSETGSDVFSSYPSSDADVDTDVDGDGERQEQSDEHKAVKIDTFPTKKPQPPNTTAAAAARSFPPPLPSLAAARTDGPSLHMHSRRVDGRLVLEAVSVPQQKYFEAQRQDGRFLLKLINNPNELPSGYDSSDEKNSVEEEKDEIFNGAGIFKHRQLNSTGVLINVHKSTVTIKKMTKRGNENSINPWSQKLNTKIVSNHLSKLEVVEEEEVSPITQSLTLPSPPPAPRTAGLPPLPPSPASFNSYQYLWRAKPTVASVIDPLITQHRPPIKTKDLVLLRDNKVDCLIPSLKGCKEPRRSIVRWEPFCIATS